MMPKKNLHWIIKAQLAKRGGRKPHVRIAPGAVPGYVAALRETNQVGDGANKRDGPLIWQPKHTSGKVQKTDGDASTNSQNFTNPAAGLIPPDFVDVGFKSLGKDSEALVSGLGAWAVPVEPESFISWHDRSVLTDRQLALESWWDQHQPQLHVDIEPWVMYQMGKSGDAFSKATLDSAMDTLSKRGSPKQRLLESEAVLITGATGDVFKRETQSYWGAVHRHEDFTAQELTVACFHFQVIDFGDSIPLTSALMRSTGNTENVERNQCVLMHLAAGLFRDESGRKTSAW